MSYTPLINALARLFAQSMDLDHVKVQTCLEEYETDNYEAAIELAKSLPEQHDGEVWITNKKRKRTIFEKEGNSLTRVDDPDAEQE